MNLQRKQSGLIATIALLLAISMKAHSAPVKADAGKFRITIQDNEIGTTTFTTDKNGGSIYDENLAIAGNKVVGHVVVKANAGLPTQVDANFTPGGRLHLVLAGAKSQLTVGTTTSALQLAPHPYLFDNFAPHLLSALVGSYNVQKGGAQKVQLVVVNAGAPVPSTLTRGATRTRVVSGSPLAITTYTLSVGGKVDIEIQADKANRILMWNVPAQKYIAVREGYSALVKVAVSTDPLLSKPDYQVKRDEKVMVRTGTCAACQPPAGIHTANACR